MGRALVSIAAHSAGKEHLEAQLAVAKGWHAKAAAPYISVALPNRVSHGRAVEERAAGYDAGLAGRAAKCLTKTFYGHVNGTGIIQAQGVLNGARNGSAQG